MSTRALLRNVRAFEALVRLQQFYAPLLQHVPKSLRDEISNITQEEISARISRNERRAPGQARVGE